MASDPRIRFALYALLGAAYAIQLHTPLRMFNDSIAYVAMAESALAGNGFLVAGAKMQWPSGYPALLAVLIHFDVFGAPSVVALNLAFLALGLFGCHTVLTRSYGLRPQTAHWVCIACLLSYGFARYAGVVLSDMVYFGLSSTSLGLLAVGESRSGRGDRIRWALAALPFALVSIWLRTIGIVLLPAIAWVALGLRGLPTLRGLGLDARTGVLAGTVAAGGAVAVAFVTRSSYFALASDQFAEWGGPFTLRSIVFVVTRRTWEQGRLWLNLREDLYPPDHAFTVLAVAGAVAIVVLARGAWEHRTRFKAVDLYIAGTIAAHAFYPFYLERHWLPVFPFMLVVAAGGLRCLVPDRWYSRLAGAWAVWFVVTGIAALALTARLSLSGFELPRYFHPNRETYEFAFGHPALSMPRGAKPMLVEQLRRYEPLAARPARPDPEAREPAR